MPPECRQWTIRTPRMTYEWQDEGLIPDGVRPRGHSLHAFVLPCAHHSGCVDGQLSTLWQQLSCSTAWVSARSFRGSPRCALTLTMNVRAPRSTLSLMHLMIVFMMSAFASPASVVRGPLPIHLDTLSRIFSLSHKCSSKQQKVLCERGVNIAIGNVFWIIRRSDD